jgi:hypothetical protein
VALGAAFRILGDRQRGQINIQPQPIPLKIMGEGAALTPEQGFAASTELTQTDFIEGIQGAHQAGLFSELGPVPSLS